MPDRERPTRPGPKTRKKRRRETPADPNKRLTVRQVRFLEELAVDPRDQTKAAIRAGYSAKSAAQIGSHLLNRPRFAHVQARWQAMVAKRAVKYEITAEKVLERIAHIAFGDIRQLASWGVVEEIAPGRFLAEGEEDEPEAPVTRSVMRLRLIPSEDLPPEAAAMIAEVKEAVYEYGSTVSVRPHSSFEALKLLARHLGLLKDRLVIEDFTRAGEEVAELIEDMAASVAEQDEILRMAREALKDSGAPPA